MQATRPRVILAPLQLGLGIEMHHHFASRFLIDSLHSHGFCSSYSTVQKFERSAAATQGTDIPGYTPRSFIQYVADNVDHNTRSLDGLDTFHGMGIIATITPGTTSSMPVPNKYVTAAEISAVGHINIRHYRAQNTDRPDHFSTGSFEILRYKMHLQNWIFYGSYQCRYFVLQGQCR